MDTGVCPRGVVSVFRLQSSDYIRSHSNILGNNMNSLKLLATR